MQVHKSSLASYTRSAVKGHTVASHNRRIALTSLEEAEQHLAVAARLALNENTTSTKPPVTSTQFVGGDLAVEASPPSVSVMLAPPSPESLVRSLAAVPLKPHVLLSHEQRTQIDRIQHRQSGAKHEPHTETLAEIGLLPAAPPLPSKSTHTLTPAALSAPLLGTHTPQQLAGLTPSPAHALPDRDAAPSPHLVSSDPVTTPNGTNRVTAETVVDATVSRQLSQSLSSASSALLLTSRRVGGGGRSITAIPSLGATHSPSRSRTVSKSSRSTPALGSSMNSASSGALLDMGGFNRFEPRVFRLGGDARRNAPAQLPVLAGGAVGTLTGSAGTRGDATGVGVGVGVGTGMLKREVGVQVTLLRPDVVLPEQEEAIRQRLRAQQRQNVRDVGTDPRSRPSTPESTNQTSTAPTASMTAMLQQMRQLASSEEALRHRLKATARQQEAQAQAWRLREQQLEDEHVRLKKDIAVLKSQLQRATRDGSAQSGSVHPGSSAANSAADLLRLSPPPDTPAQMELPHVMQVDVSARALGAAEAFERAVEHMRERCAVEGKCICAVMRSQDKLPSDVSAGRASAAPTVPVIRRRARSVPSQRRVHAQLAYEQHRRFLAQCWCETDAEGCCVHVASAEARAEAWGLAPHAVGAIGARQNSVLLQDSGVDALHVDLSSGAAVLVAVHDDVQTDTDHTDAQASDSDDDAGAAVPGPSAGSESEALEYSVDLGEDRGSFEEHGEAHGEDGGAAEQAGPISPARGAARGGFGVVTRNMISPRRARNARTGTSEAADESFFARDTFYATPPRRQCAGRCK